MYFVVMLSVENKTVIVSVVMLSVVKRYAKCCYAECYNAERRSTHFTL